MVSHAFTVLLSVWHITVKPRINLPNRGKNMKHANAPMKLMCHDALPGTRATSHVMALEVNRSHGMAKYFSSKPPIPHVRDASQEAKRDDPNRCWSNVPLGSS